MQQYLDDRESSLYISLRGKPTVDLDRRLHNFNLTHLPNKKAGGSPADRFSSLAAAPMNSCEHHPASATNP